MAAAWRTVDPPAAGKGLSLHALREHAALELAEEVGSLWRVQELSLWTAVQCLNGNVGLCFRAPARPWPMLREGFEDLRRCEIAQGREPEFAEIGVVTGPGDVDALRPAADFLAPAARSFFESSTLTG